MRVLAVLCLAAALASPPVQAQAVTLVPDIRVLDIDGRDYWLAELWAERPLLVTLFYTRCVGVCSPYLLSLAETMAAYGGAGRDYDVLALSFDPEDVADEVRVHAGRLGLAGKPGWLFATAAAADVKALADVFGFWYRLDAMRRQYDHPAMTGVVVDGRVVRVLKGNPVNGRAFLETLWELKGNFVPTYAMPGRQALLSCLQYDPITGRARPNWGLLVLSLPGLVALGLTGLIFARPDRNYTQRQK